MRYSFTIAFVISTIFLISCTGINQVSSVKQHTLEDQPIATNDPFAEKLQQAFDSREKATFKGILEKDPSNPLALNNQAVLQMLTLAESPQKLCDQAIITYFQKALPRAKGYMISQTHRPIIALSENRDDPERLIFKFIVAQPARKNDPMIELATIVNSNIESCNAINTLIQDRGHHLRRFEFFN